jgi:protein phosphatase
VANAGEVASDAATFIKAELGRWMSEGGHEANGRELKRAWKSASTANRSISRRQPNPQYAGMGIALVMAVFQGVRT